MADLIDLSLIAESRKHLTKLLDARGLNYFLQQDARRPFRLEPKKVELVVRAAAKGRRRGTVPAQAWEHARGEVRKLLLRHVVEEMLQVGL